jgi:hypothetical protein
LSILAVSALVGLSIIFFEPISKGPSSARAASVGCSGALATDYACHQQRYQDMTRDLGVRAAFAELKEEYKEDEFVKHNCHQMTHVIGRTAVGLYGDLPSTYDRGDPFCEAGYYHGAIEALVARTPSGEILEEADALCADTGRRHEQQPFNHYNCPHGLGHAFMAMLGYELFEALEACDVALTDARKKEFCYSGVFMQNIMDEDNSSEYSKHLKADQPFYPCTDVEARYKKMCYPYHVVYALETQGNDYSRVFDLCATAVEIDFRTVCYQALGKQATMYSIEEYATVVGQTTRTGTLCSLGEHLEARSDCAVGAVRQFIFHYHSDEQARAFCESINADSRAVCLRVADEYHAKEVVRG